MLLGKNRKGAYFFHFGENNNRFLDKLCAALLAVTPLLQHYKGLLVDAGITVLILLLPWVTLRFVQLIGRRGLISRSQLAAVLGLLIFFFYRTFIHGFSVMELAYNGVMILYVLAAAAGCINIKYYLRTALCISFLACMCIILQYIAYYGGGIHIQMVPTSLFLPEAEQWIEGAKTGVVGITGRVSDLYRPSAFFLEPSHMFLYTFPHLFVALFAPDFSRKRLYLALVFTVGLLFTTSGMGILTVAGAWGVYFALTSRRSNRVRLQNLLKVRNLTMILLLLVGGAVIILAVPFVRGSVMRFLDLSHGGAIAGRTRLAADLIAKSLTGRKVLFGVTNTLEGLDFNMSGFAATLYKFGLIGVLLSYTTYFFGIFRTKNQYFWISLMVVVISFFSAHTHGTFYMIYYVFLILEGNDAAMRSRRHAAQQMEQNRKMKMAA